MTRQLLHLMAMVGILALSAAMIAGCGQRDDLPVVVADRTACSNCKMLVSETDHATAFKVEDEYRVFDDLGCMLDQMESDRTLKPTKILVREQGSDVWIDGEVSSYVHSESFKTPMGYGYRAFAQKPAAQHASDQTGGQLFGDLAMLRAHFANEHAQR